MLWTPGKKKIRAKPVTGIDDFDKGVINVTENELLTVGKLRAKLRLNINFQGCEKCLPHIINEPPNEPKSTKNNKDFNRNILNKIIYKNLNKTAIIYKYRRVIICSCLHGSTGGLKKVYI